MVQTYIIGTALKFIHVRFKNLNGILIKLFSKKSQCPSDQRHQIKFLIKFKFQDGFMQPDVAGCNDCLNCFM